VFLDTSYVLALFGPRDAHHVTARTLAAALAHARTRFVTTRAVLLEIGNALARPATRAAAVEILRTLDTDPATEVVPLTDARYAQALALYAARADQAWGLTDCLSFVVMHEFGLTSALTADRHFEQAGFRALLRSGPA